MRQMEEEMELQMQRVEDRVRKRVGPFKEISNTIMLFSPISTAAVADMTQLFIMGVLDLYFVRPEKKYCFTVCSSLPPVLTKSFP